MAIISTIRSKAAVAVGLVALSLGLFIVGSDIIGPGSTFFGRSARVIGEVDGEDVMVDDFQKEYQRQESQFSFNQGKSPGESEQQQLRDQSWNQIIFQKAYTKEFDKLGLEVSEDEVEDMIKGDNIHPAIQSAPIFKDQKTGQFNKQLVGQYEQALGRQPQQQQVAWQLFKSQLPQERIRNKYNALLTKTNYVTRLEATREYHNATAKADVQYVFANYYSIPDSTIKVDDGELEKYLADHKYRFKTQDNRALEYVEWKLAPSTADSITLKTDLAKIKEGFATADNDTAFAARESDQPTKVEKFTIAQMPPELAPEIPNLAQGQVYGPFASGNSMVLYKVVGVGAEPEARASHILFSTQGKDKDSARMKAEAVLAQVKAGGDFAELARTKSEDPGSAMKGGDLDYFDKTRMVKPFADAVFERQTPGLVDRLVESDFGFHIIKVTDRRATPKYELVSIRKTTAPSDETTEGYYQKASVFASNAGDKAAFDAEVAKQKLTKQTAAYVFKTGNGVNDMSEAREIVRWAYDKDTKVGTTKMFTLPDRMVVATLTRITEEGKPTVDDVREQLTAEVRKDKKAEQIIGKLGKGSFEEMVKRYPGTQTNTATDVTLNTPGIMDIGSDPETIGKVFGLKVNATTAPYRGETGVVVIKVTKRTDAPKVDKNFDLSSYKQQIDQKAQGRMGYAVDQAIQEVAGVKDNRVRFY